MKTLTAGMLAHLQLSQTTLCTCYHITRRDNVEFHFTDHDQPVLFEGDTYTPELTNRTAITNKDDLSVDNLEIAGAFDSAAITEQDLRNGLFDYAEVRVFLVNWRTPADGRIPLRRGWLGEVRATDAGFFFAEMRGLAQRLSTHIVEISTPECRADLGDKRCKVPVDPPSWATGINYDDERFPAPLDLKLAREGRLPGSALVTDWVTPTVRNNRVFRCIVEGRSNPVEPTWDTTIGNTTSQPWAGFTAWTSAQVVALGAVRRATATPTNRLFVCTTAGTTGALEPTWNTTVDGTTNDNGVIWTTYPLPPQWIAEDAYNKVGEVDGLTPFAPTRRVFQVLASNFVGATGFYNFGVLEWTSGPNTGRRHEVRDWINAAGIYVQNVGLPNLDFIQQVGNDVARRDAGSWITDGFVPGMRLSVSGSPAQDGTYLVATVTALDLTIVGGWPAQNLNTTGATITGSLRQVTLFTRTAFDVASGDEFLMYHGCQKRMLQDCRDVHDNIINNRAEAYLPGNDSRFEY